MGTGRVSVAICALAFVATQATAQDAQNVAAPAQQKPAKEKKVCRQEETTGSIMPSRICHTSEQWTAIDGANQNNTEQSFRHTQGAGSH